MTVRSLIAKICGQEALNFVLTNFIPRRTVTLFIGWFSQIEHPFVRDLSIGIWRLFSDLDLSDAKKTQFRSMHDCFTRELRDGARPVNQDPAFVVSPCDAIIGASGGVVAGQLLQIKGSRYTLRDLFGGSELVDFYRDGIYTTLRLTSSMYHRFHAPHDCRVDQVTYIPGDVWNVNPATLKRVDRLFCRNERALIRTQLAGSNHVVTLVPVAAILVASIRLHFLDMALNLKHAGPNDIVCDARFRKGEEMGWFEHGSTFIVLAPGNFALCDEVREGQIIRVGQPLMRLPRSPG